MPRLSRRTFVATAGASAIAACAPWTSGAGGWDAIRIGFVSQASARPLRTALAAGLFAKHGLHDVELVHLPSFGAVRDHVTAGTIHGGALPRTIAQGSSPHALCAERIALVMLRRANVEPVEYVRNSLERYGLLTLGTACSQHVDQSMFLRSGLDPSAVRPILLPPGQIDLNLQSGDIDIACVDVSESDSETRVRLALSNSSTIYDLSIDPVWQAHSPRAALALRAVFRDERFPFGMPVASLGLLNRV
jgi:hypothetical protein